MRIGDINMSNYGEYVKLFSNKNTNKSPAQPERLSEAEVVRRAQLADPHSYGIPGMDITGKDPSEWQKIVDVSDDIREKMIRLAKSEFINNYGMTDGEEVSLLIRNYVLTLPENERTSAAWTLGEIFGNESSRIHKIVKDNIPDWKGGQPFDRGYVTNLVSNSIDIKA